MGNEGKPDVVGQNIRRLLDEQGLGVNALARKAGLPKPSTVTELLKGRSRTARVDTLLKLADALGVDMEDLTLTQREVTESERLIAAFEKAEDGAKRLVPPYNDNDAARLRARRAEIVRRRPPNKAIRHIIRALRSRYGEPDFAE